MAPATPVTARRDWCPSIEGAARVAGWSASEEEGRGGATRVRASSRCRRLSIPLRGSSTRMRPAASPNGLRTLGSASICHPPTMLVGGEVQGAVPVCIVRTLSDHHHECSWRNDGKNTKQISKLTKHPRCSDGAKTRKGPFHLVLPGGDVEGAARQLCTEQRCLSWLRRLRGRVGRGENR